MKNASRTTELQQIPPSSDIWEYAVLQSSDIAKVNGMGAEGWELVSIVHEAPGTDTFYFKRRRSLSEVQPRTTNGSIERLERE